MGVEIDLAGVGGYFDGSYFLMDGLGEWGKRGQNLSFARLWS